MQGALVEDVLKVELIAECRQRGGDELLHGGGPPAGQQLHAKLEVCAQHKGAFGVFKQQHHGYVVLQALAQSTPRSLCIAQAL